MSRLSTFLHKDLGKFDVTWRPVIALSLLWLLVLTGNWLLNGLMWLGGLFVAAVAAYFLLEPSEARHWRQIIRNQLPVLFVGMVVAMAGFGFFLYLIYFGVE